MLSKLRSNLSLQNLNFRKSFKYLRPCIKDCYISISTTTALLYENLSKSLLYAYALCICVCAVNVLNL